MMMRNALAVVVGAAALLGIFVTASAACDDIESYFGDVGSVSEIDLGSVIRVDCPANDEGGPLEEILIASGTSLTIKSTQDYVRFVNVRFTAEEGATLVFDMPITRFGPNSGSTEGGTEFMLEVSEGASVTFMGKFRASQIKNIRSVFYNSGAIDFKGDSLFINNGNVFRSNSNGTLKFRGDAVFKNNSWLALDLIGPDSFVRFSKTATFDNNARGFDGATGCAVDNSEGRVIFRDDAYFSNHRCDEGSAVYNGGTMKFYGKVQFEDNTSQSYWGGGVLNGAGTLLFKKAVQFNRNDAEIGGGLAVTGGEVTFQKAVKFDSNQADETGGAFAVFDEGTVTFEKPEVVRYENNFIYDNPFNDETVTGCSLAYVEEDATVIGFDVDDVCMEVTV